MKKGFRDEFKFFKKKDTEPDFNRIINFNKIGSSFKDNVVLMECRRSEVDWKENFCMKNPSDWEIYSFLKKPGLLFIKNPFYNYGQRYWIIKCLEYYTKKPSKLNIDSHALLSSDEDWWEYCHRKFSENSDILKKLRWATFGYHHNWDTKVYSEDSKCDFPSDLSALCSFLGQELGFSEFKAQAAIINIYHFGSSLSGHTDHSEVNVEAPLFSFSFGQSAIFLIGSRSLEDESLPILLESGDIIIMTGESRLCYHGVPKILKSEKQPWNKTEEDLNEKCSSKYYCKEVTDKLWCDEKWEPFESFIKNTRINMNIRQVLHSGQKVLQS